MTVPPLVYLQRIVKALYAHLSRLSWDALASLAAMHFAISYIVMRQFENGGITEFVEFWYFYATTATTIGYGDVTPKTDPGRLLTTFWIMPGGIVLFTAGIAKFVQFVADRWRKSMRGESDYSYLVGHIVILGWQGLRTQRIIEEIVGDVGAAQREIVLCTTKTMENPLPDIIKFVRGKSLNDASLHRRAGVRGARVIIALGHDDNDTLAASLAAAAVNDDAHIVAYFEQEALADLLRAHCSRAEAMVSLSMEMMVRAAQDPGSSRLHHNLLSVHGQTQFSMSVPPGAAIISYGRLLTVLKERHDVTLLAIADDILGKGLQINAPLAHPVRPGTVIYYIALTRLQPEAIAWGGMD